MNLRSRPFARRHRVSGLRRRQLAQCHRVSNLRRRPTAQRRREQALTETPACSMAPSTGAAGSAEGPPPANPPIPPLVLGGRLGSARMRQGEKATPPPSPKRGAGGAAPAGGTACPPVLENVGGWAGGTTARPRQSPPLKEGASHNRTPVPQAGCRGCSVPTPVVGGRLGSVWTRQMSKRPSVPQAGCRGRSPRRGYRGCPPVPKNVGGWAGGTTAHAKPDPPLKEGARQAKTIRPHRRADAGVRGPCHPPIVKYEQVCYSTPMKSAAGPLLFLGVCRIHEHWGLATENPPVAGALREHPKGQDPPRKAGTEANAASTQALWSR